MLDGAGLAGLVVGAEAEPLLDLSLEDEPEPDVAPEGALLEPEAAEPEGEDDGEDGVVLLEDDPLGVRDAPLLLPLSQPYRPPTATAMGRRTNADFFKRLI